MSTVVKEFRLKFCLIVAEVEFGGVKFTLAYKIDTIRRIILEQAVK
jgi:hypothetical protein